MIPFAIFRRFYFARALLSVAAMLASSLRAH